MSRPSLVMPITASASGAIITSRPSFCSQRTMRSPRGVSVYFGFWPNIVAMSVQPASGTRAGRVNAAPRRERRRRLRWVNSVLLLFVHVDQHRRNGLELAVADRAEETVVPPGVAGDAGLLDLDQQRVAVAVDAEIDQRLDVT